MEKKLLGNWIIIIGITILGVGIFLYIFCVVFHFFGGWLLCSMNIILLLVILGPVYIVVGGLTRNKKGKSS